ncbi:NERD domain-containing protein [Escherichia coli]|nr:NERD domain-containing protein [Escherichia coli]
MDTLLQFWQWAGFALIIMLLAVLFCLFEFVCTDIKEQRTAKAIAAYLPDDADGLMSDLTLPVRKNSTTQVDHVLIAPHGLYVIEQKNYAGNLKGEERDSHWYKTLRTSNLKLQNPFRQNYGHVKAVEQALNLQGLEYINVVIINGPCRYLGQKPEWLCMGMEQFIAKVNARKHMNVLNPESVRYICDELKMKRKPPGLLTDLRHIRFVTNKHQKSMRFSQWITLGLLNTLDFVYNRIKRKLNV